MASLHLRTVLPAIAVLSALACISDAKTIPHYPNRWNLDDLPQYAPTRQVSGTIRVWGLNYLASYDGNIPGYWQAGFGTHQPNVKIQYAMPAAVNAISGLISGEGDFDAGRACISCNELFAFERIYHHDPLELTIMTGSMDISGHGSAWGILVHKDNPIQGITLKQLDGIFGAARSGGWVGSHWHPEFARGPEGNLRTWGQLGLSGEWAGQPINPYGLTLRYQGTMGFADRVIAGSDKWNERTKIYANFTRPDGSMELATVDQLDAVSRDRYGIAYAGVQHVTRETKCVPLSESDGGPFITATVETVRARTYPLYIPIIGFINRDPGAPVEPKLKEFLAYILSREGQDAVQRDGKFLPLTGDVVRRELAKLL